MKAEKKILYISYDGLLEHLGQSQILYYLKNLSSNFIFFLITFEKKTDWNDIENVKKIKQIVHKSNIYWIPLSYTSKPYLISTLIDISKAILKSFFLIHQKKIKIIHARGYIAGLIAYLLRFFTNIKFSGKPLLRCNSNTFSATTNARQAATPTSTRAMPPTTETIKR